MEQQSSFEIAQGQVGTAAPDAASQQQQTPPAAGGAPASSGEQLVEIKWNGKTEKVPFAQAVELAQKGYDYTQKMQQLAKDREAFGGERQRYEAAIAEVRTFLQDQKRVEAYLNELRRQGGVASSATGEAGDSGAPITQEELERRIKAARDEFAGYTQEQVAEVRRTLQVEALAGQYATELGSYIDSLKKQIPELAAIPKVEKFLKDEVRAMGPRSMDEAKSMIQAVAQEKARDIQNFLMAQRKGEAVGQASGAATNPLANGIEPKGGSGPLPPASNQKFKGFSDPAFRAAVIADLEAPVQR